MPFVLLLFYAVGYRANGLNCFSCHVVFKVVFCNAVYPYNFCELYHLNNIMECFIFVICLILCVFFGREVIFLNVMVSFLA